MSVLGFNSSIVIMSLLSSVTSVLLSSSVPSSSWLPCSFEFSIVFFPFCFFIGSILSLSLSCSCSCLNILKPRLRVSTGEVQTKFQRLKTGPIQLRKYTPTEKHAGPENCFSTAGPRSGTGTWHQLYRAARGLRKLQYATRFH